MQANEEGGLSERARKRAKVLANDLDLRVTAPRAPTSTANPPAIYTRKSTEDGLEQEFNSLDAQRDSAESYIRSQQHEGWVCVPKQYDDGGFTGANMERPGLR